MQVYSMCTKGYTARLVYSQKMLLSNCYFKSQQFPFSPLVKPSYLPHPLLSPHRRGSVCWQTFILHEGGLVSEWLWQMCFFWLSISSPEWSGLGINPSLAKLNKRTILQIPTTSVCFVCLPSSLLTSEERHAQGLCTYTNVSEASWLTMQCFCFAKGHLKQKDSAFTAVLLMC